LGNIADTDEQCSPAVLRVARLAVDDRFQAHGIGRLLLRAMLELAIKIRGRVGCTGVVVDAKLDAVDCYSGPGFKVIKLVRGALGDRPEPVVMLSPFERLQWLQEKGAKPAIRGNQRG